MSAAPHSKSPAKKHAAAGRRKKNANNKSQSGNKQKLKRKSIVKPKHKRWLAAKCTAGVAILQGAMLLTWWVAPTWDPPRVRIMNLIWAWMHQPTFYPFVALLIGGPVLTVIAIRIAGTHRIWLVVSWLAFCLVAWNVFQHRLLVMVDVLRWKYDL